MNLRNAEFNFLRTLWILCERPIASNDYLAEMLGLDPQGPEAISIGLNYGSWSVRHVYDGKDFMPLVQEA